MNPSPQAIEASYDFCRRMSLRAKSNLCAGFLLLPRAKRRAMHALYAFMRFTDDLADNPRSADERGEELQRWRAAFASSLAGDGKSQPNEAIPAQLTDHPIDATAHALLPAVVDTVGRFAIPPEHLYAVIDGVEMDLQPRRYETFEELEAYCRLVASAVGLACVHVWGFRGREALRPARQCGIALQLTNILRDLGEDAGTGRVYLPSADLQACDYSADELLQGVADTRFDRLMELEIDRAEQYYRQGAELMPWLEPDGRRVFGIMMATYRALLLQIKRRPRDVLVRRVRVGFAKKLRIAARWTLWPPHTAALL